MLENDEADKIDSLLDNPDSLSLSGLTGEGREFSDRLARVLRTGSYQARIVAARTLGRQGDLDNVPILIYALSDGDPRVVREAQAGLRLTSRKFDGIELSEDFKPADIAALVAQWKAWYKAVRPDAVFIE
jgi:HEAT repeat protein